MTSGERLAQVRKSLNLTQVAFAKKLNVSRAAYVSYELGERDIPTSLAVKLSQDCDVYTSWLLEGRGPQTPKIRQQNILDAVEVVEAFNTAKKLKLVPEMKARLILHLINYFDEGGSPDTMVAKQILENAL